MGKLTLKQKKFVKEYLNSNGNATQAALAAYDTDNKRSAEQIGYENLRKLEVQNAIGKELEGKGITLDYVVENIKENMEAGRGVKATAKDSLRASDMLLKAMGLYEQSKRPSQHLHITYNYNEMSKEELLEEREKMRNLTDQILASVLDQKSSSSKR